MRCCWRCCWRQTISLQLHFRALSSEQMRCDLGQFHCSIFQTAQRWKHPIARCKQKQNRWNASDPFHFCLAWTSSFSLVFSPLSVLSSTFVDYMEKQFLGPIFCAAQIYFPSRFLFLATVFSPRGATAAAAINSIDLLFPQQSLLHPSLLLFTVDHFLELHIITEFKPASSVRQNDTVDILRR